MNNAKNHPHRKRKHLVAWVFLLMASITFAAFRFTGNDEFGTAKRQVLLREIGHKLLLASGDSTSRVLPVTETGVDKYQLRFEKEFTFQTDSLVRIIRQALEQEDHSQDYIVNVLDCGKKDVLFGYAIFKNGQKNIIPCSGRKQTKGCYLVTIEFKTTGMAGISSGYVIGGASLFAFMGILAVRPMRRRTQARPMVTGAPQPAEEGGTRLGNTIFHPGNRVIIVSGMTIELTPKENKLFLILSKSPNEVIERSRIQKEIWEDEGVIVGRSLDMFISKLRKKLENDPSVQLVNIHGKGYKLQVGAGDNT